MPRLLTRSLQVVVDLVALSLAFWLAYLFRFEFRIPRTELSTLLVTWPYLVVLQYGSLTLFGVPRMAWRYLSMRDVVRVAFAMAAAGTVFVLLRLIVPTFTLHAQLVVVPLGVSATDFVLGFLGIVSIRAMWRMQTEASARRKHVPVDKAGGTRVLLIGAGQAGVMVAREISARPDLGLVPVGFLDDDQMKVGTSIAGIPVLGTTADVKRIAERVNAQRTLIAIASASGQQIRQIAERCRDAELDTKIIPGIYEIVGNKVNLSRIREVAIEDLLGRAPVELDEEIVGATIGSRVVLVTGAGGSIGSELCRQICRFGPSRLILVERFENAMFEIHRELTSSFPQVPIEPRIADVCDESRMTGLFEACRPHLVFHAAAHKHVPMMEWNPGEAVKNNIGGTRLIADLADRYAAERFVLISTDKAVNPTSMMGATKRVAELYLQGLSQRSQTRFVTVRFGNVLGSAGSVIPIFRQQIAKGGPVTVTHPEMTRYFMTIPEASQLVLQAGAMGGGSEIFILDMGEPVKIVDLARDLIALSGLRPEEDIEIEFTGIRPGEKLFEELSTEAESADKTKHPKIMIGRIKPHAWDAVAAGIETLLALARDGADADALRRSMGEMIPEYSGAGRSRPMVAMRDAPNATN